MNAKFTPGPWVRSRRTIQSESGTICETFSHLGIAEADANERLIAAAPDLLEVLIEYGLPFEDESAARAEFGDKQVDRELRRRNVIAKATGEPQ